MQDMCNVNDTYAELLRGLRCSLQKCTTNEFLHEYAAAFYVTSLSAAMQLQYEGQVHGRPRRDAAQGFDTPYEGTPHADILTSESQLLVSVLTTGLQY